MSAEEGPTVAPSPNDEHALRSVVLPMLQVACLSKTPVAVMAAHMSLSCTGRLRSASGEGVVIELPNPPDGTLLGSTAAVTFPSGAGTKGFVSEVTAIDKAPEGDTLATLALPDQLRAGTRRSAVRIPVPRDTLVGAIVQGDGVRGNVVPVDISLTGILIELDALRAQRVALGTRLSLRIALESLELLVPCEVRRKDGRRLGLLFVTDGPPPKQMAKIMWRLQQDQLLSR
ncbi:MAG: PilZ domain-containing protein [Nannocystaceae bacterium]|nr:PilZ domain-containing protein [Nannocystaceae bacterium]